MPFTSNFVFKRLLSLFLPDQPGGSERSGPWRAAAPRAPLAAALTETRTALRGHVPFIIILSSYSMSLTTAPPFPPCPHIVFCFYSDIYCCSNFLSETKCSLFRSLKCVGLFCFVSFVCFWFLFLWFFWVFFERLIYI